MCTDNLDNKILNLEKKYVRYYVIYIVDFEDFSVLGCIFNAASQ